MLLRDDEAFDQKKCLAESVGRGGARVQRRGEERDVWKEEFEPPISDSGNLRGWLSVVGFGRLFDTEVNET